MILYLLCYTQIPFYKQDGLIQNTKFAFLYKQIYHTLIIAGFILSFSGCGYKGDPVYVADKPTLPITKNKEASK